MDEVRNSGVVTFLSEPQARLASSRSSLRDSEGTPIVDRAVITESSDSDTLVAFEDPHNIDFDIQGGTRQRHSGSSRTQVSPPRPLAGGRGKAVTRRASIFGSFFGSLRRRKTHRLGVKELLRKVSMADIKLTRSTSRQDRSDENWSDSGMDDEKPADPELRTGTDSEEMGEGSDQMSIEGALMMPGVLPTENPFKTPPHTPSTMSLPLSPVTNTHTGSPDSMTGSVKRRKTQRARLMSRMKSVQILGVEASSAVAAKWRLDGWDSR